VEDKSKFKPIPLIYGNWSSAIAGSVSVPVACSNTSTLQFKAAHHRIKSIDRYLKNGARISPSNVKNVSLSAATFQLSSLAYNATDDVISINCQGLMTINSSLIEKPSDILRSLLNSYIGLTATDLNVTAFNTMNISGTISEVARRWIGSEVSSETLVQELLADAQADLRFVRGKYAPKYRSLDLAANRTDIRDVDIAIDEQSEKAEFSVEMDPLRLYANRIRGRYRFDPVNDRYDIKYVVNATGQQANVSSIVERPMDLNWYYVQGDAETRISRELMIFSKEPVNIQARLTNRAMLLNLADQIDITYDVFNDRTVQIRKLETDLAGMTTRISGFNLFMIGVGRWTADSAPNWNAASMVQRQEQGFWSNAAGYASASDGTSYLASRWY
jgi:hypothetical protein